MEIEINKCEIYILKCLNYKIDYFTSLHYLQLFSLNGIMFSDDFIKDTYKPSKRQDLINNLTISKIYEKQNEILDFLIEEEQYLKIPPIYIALSAVVLSRQIFKINSKYPEYIENTYKIKFEEFESFYNTIKE